MTGNRRLATGDYSYAVLPKSRAPSGSDRCWFHTCRVRTGAVCTPLERARQEHIARIAGPVRGGDRPAPNQPAVHDSIAGPHHQARDAGADRVIPDTRTATPARSARQQTDRRVAFRV